VPSGCHFYEGLWLKQRHDYKSRLGGTGGRTKGFCNSAPLLVRITGPKWTVMPYRDGVGGWSFQHGRTLKVFQKRYILANALEGSLFILKILYPSNI
jgi:hypothetical protein